MKKSLPMSLKEIIHKALSFIQDIHHHDINFVCGVIYEFIIIVNKTLGREYIDARYLKLIS